MESLLINERWIINWFELRNIFYYSFSQSYKPLPKKSDKFKFWSKGSAETPNQSFINGEDNFMIDNLADGANKFEVLLVGSSNPTLTIGGNHFLFNINNWNSLLE